MHLSPMTYQFHCVATALGVRDVMILIKNALSDQQTSADVRSSVEIAVAEGLNNIVIHAVKGDTTARIGVQLSIDPIRIMVHLRDPGEALPGWRTPGMRERDLSVARADLPEGGFGWNLIHTLTDRLDYRRINGNNQLSMWFNQSTDARSTRPYQDLRMS